MVNRKVDDKNVIVAQLGESLTNEVLERYDESKVKEKVMMDSKINFIPDLWA
jgi:hypothetical protein